MRDIVLDPGETFVVDSNSPLIVMPLGECATVGGPAAFVNAVLDAIKDSGVRNIDMPLLPDRVYEALTQRHDVSGAPPVRSDD